MGAYLSEPITEKHSEDDSNDVFSYGLSSMQGWRISQEDAHNALLNFDESMAYFAVYDGHGGSEVANYCSENLPDFLKTVPNFKKQDYKQALIDAFLQFDKKFCDREILEELRKREGLDSGDSDAESGEVNNLVEMARKPLSHVLAEYKKSAEDSLNQSSSSKEESPSTSPVKSDVMKGETSGESSKINTSPRTRERKVKTDVQVNGNSEVNGESSKEHSEVNGDAEPKGGKGSGKKTGKTILRPAQIGESNSKPKSSGVDLYEQIKQDQDISDDSEESEDLDDEESIQSDEEEDIEDEEDTEEDDVGPDGEGEFDCEKAEENEFSEEPGYDSGCTACVAMIHKKVIYVANVGDSRCVVCRDGKPIELSKDHSPEDEGESKRIVAAGGAVTEDGRVNGGLNLSRALGDHSYKLNGALPPEEQMISPLPDVQVHEIQPTDSFMVLACDGIWNSMTSAEVCDYVSERLDNCDSLSSICESMLDSCLAPDKYGDGLGCDNMTCIIVKLNYTGEVTGKRPADSPAELEEELRSTKKSKTEQSDSTC